MQSTSCSVGFTGKLRRWDVVERRALPTGASVCYGVVRLQSPAMTTAPTKSVYA
jgi:hypothetical protein